MITLDKLQILKMHKNLVQSINGTNGLRDINALDTAINNSFSNVILNQKQTSDIDKIAKLTYNIIKLKPFIENNTSMGIYCMLVLFELNNISISYNKDEIIELGRKLSYLSINYNSFVKWIKNHIDS